MSRQLPLVLLLLWAVGLSGCSAAAPEAPVDDTPVRVRAFVERSDVTPGKPFTLTVEIDRQEGVVFELPDVGAQIKGLVIMNQKQGVPERVGNRELLRSTYKLKAPLAGTYLIPGVEAPWKTADNQVGTAGTGPILIEAARLAGEEGAGEETLRDLKPLAPPDPDPRLWIAAAGVAALALLLGLWLLRRRARSATEAPPLPADQQALLDLARLERLDPFDAANHAPIAYEVSAILRRYLEARFAFSAWKMTTQEVLRSMPAELVSRRDVPAAVQDVLEASDRVKFAGEDVDGKVLSGWIERARRVVETTASVPSEEDAA